jgi:hypothetical protein
MRDTQAKVIAILAKAAEDNGLELVNDTQWANTGTLHVTSPFDVTPIISVRYAFHDEYSTFTVTPGHGLGRKGDGQLHAVKVEELQQRLILPVISAIQSARATA